MFTPSRFNVAYPPGGCIKTVRAHAPSADAQYVVQRGIARMPQPQIGIQDTCSLWALTGAALGGSLNRLPRRLPRAVRIATNSQVKSRPA
ncbi:riboflavin synthase subunit alpha [Mycobacterium ahvazicum]|uniref:Riboflavin synthase subunit alpha n=1 Tax=Mycobacterium ahvazicum TaxID=1964395 RepID=A0A2K4YHB8_9MYCO|nr:riboflavin synthase subunit alpha [Mycobacterium ahvazicum]